MEQYDVVTHGIFEHSDLDQTDIPDYQESINLYYGFKDGLNIPLGFEDIIRSIRIPRIVSVNKKEFVLRWTVVTNEKITKEQETELNKDIQDQCLVDGSYFWLELMGL